MTLKPATPGRRPSGLWVVIVLILIPPVVVPLWVPLYDKETPTLWGFPFFYWFQFLLILCSAVITIVAFLLSQVADRKSHEDHR
jgi:hypothetical protein